MNLTEEQRKLITEIFNRPLPYKHAGIDVHLQSHEAPANAYVKYNPKHLYRFQAPGIKVDKKGVKRKVKNTYDVEIYHHDNKPLSTKDTSQHGEVIFRKKSKSDGKDDVTATGDSGKMSPHVFSTVLHIAHNHARRHDLTHLRFSASNKEPSRVSLYKTASERYGGGVIPPDKFERRVKSELPARARERGLRGDYLHPSLNPSLPFQGRISNTKQNRINAIGWAANIPRSAGNAVQRQAIWRAATGSTEFKIPVKDNKNERAANLGKQGPENEEESKRIETRMKDIHAKANSGAPKSRNGWQADDYISFDESINNTDEQVDLLKEYIILSEARIKIVKLRIRRGKIQRRKKVSNVKGFTMRGGKLTRMPTRERLKRKIGQRRGKLKRKAKKARMLLARKRAIRKRKALGLK